MLEFTMTAENRTMRSKPDTSHRQKTGTMGIRLDFDGNRTSLGSFSNLSAYLKSSFG